MNPKKVEQFLQRDQQQSQKEKNTLKLRGVLFDHGQPSASDRIGTKSRVRRPAVGERAPLRLLHLVLWVLLHLAGVSGTRDSQQGVVVDHSGVITFAHFCDTFGNLHEKMSGGSLWEDLCVLRSGHFPQPWEELKVTK